MYVTLNPCNECAKLIVQSGVKEVIYLSAKKFKDNALDAAMHNFKNSEVIVRHYKDVINEKYRESFDEDLKIELSLKAIEYGDN